MSDFDPVSGSEHLREGEAQPDSGQSETAARVDEILRELRVPDAGDPSPPATRGASNTQAPRGDTTGSDAHEGQGQQPTQDSTRAASSTQPPKGEDNQPDGDQSEQQHTPATSQNRSHETGNVQSATSPPVSQGDDISRAKHLVKSVPARLMREKRWFGQIALERDDMMKAAAKRFPDKTERQLWVYGELDRMYPPLTEKQKGTLSPSTGEAGKPGQADDGQIQGLSGIPGGWPELPANASLAAELAWVQANRLRVVEERPGQAALVKLDRAHAPAPSWAALGWLETSIRSYAKYVDVAAKATSAGDDEAAVVKRERLSIARVDELLDEMKRQAEGGG